MPTCARARAHVCVCVRDVCVFVSVVVMCVMSNEWTKTRNTPCTCHLAKINILMSYILCRSSYVLCLLYVLCLIMPYVFLCLPMSYVSSSTVRPLAIETLPLPFTRTPVCVNESFQTRHDDDRLASAYAFIPISLTLRPQPMSTQEQVIGPR